MTVLELVVYQIGLLIVITASVGVMGFIYTTHRAQWLGLHQMTTLEYMYGVLERDIQQSYADQAVWQIHADQSLHSPTQQVRWYCKGSHLIREQTQARKKHRSTVVKNIDKLQISSVHKGTRAYMQMTLTQGTKKFERWFEVPGVVRV